MPNAGLLLWRIFSPIDTHAYFLRQNEVLRSILVTWKARKYTSLWEYHRPGYGTYFPLLSSEKGVTGKQLSWLSHRYLAVIHCQKQPAQQPAWRPLIEGYSLGLFPFRPPFTRAESCSHSPNPSCCLLLGTNVSWPTGEPIHYVGGFPTTYQFRWVAPGDYGLCCRAGRVTAWLFLSRWAVTRLTQLSALTSTCSSSCELETGWRT